jgi:hypothetical protein
MATMLKAYKAPYGLIDVFNSLKKGLSIPMLSSRVFKTGILTGKFIKSLYNFRSLSDLAAYRKEIGIPILIYLGISPFH